MSYAEVLRRARLFGARLKSLGLTPGERVVLNCPNSLDYVCAYFGVWIAGGTAVPLDPRSRAAHVDRICRDCQARIIVVATARADLDPALRQVALEGFGWTGAPGPELLEPPSNPLPLIIYTSGTTGDPRGVCLSHANLEHTRASITAWAKVKESDRELTTLSLTHLFGLAHLHVYGALGGTVCIEEGFRDVPRLLDLIDRLGITSFPGTPGGLKIILDRFADLFAVKASRLRYMIINTAPMPVAHTEALLSLLPATEIFMYYGLTEASRSTYIAYRDHPGKLQSVGRATPGAEVCVGDPAARQIGEPGEILVRGPHVTSGYWSDGSRELFEQGWFRTGDLGSMDEAGFLTWLGRVREQINVNGLKLVPAEVEDVLRLDERVLECAAVGVPDPAAGEAVIAFVVARPGADRPAEKDLRRLCHQKLEDHKVPRRVLFVEEIPKTDSGKVKRLLLRERWLKAGSLQPPGATTSAAR
jgi:long-chain acyl-CoA synthetase